MSEFEQCSNELQFHIIFTFGQFSVSRKLILNGGAIGPRDLLFLINPENLGAFASLLMYVLNHFIRILTDFMNYHTITFYEILIYVHMFWKYVHIYFHCMNFG